MEKDHASYKEDAFIIAAADDAITREEMFSLLMMKILYLITNFQNLTNLLPFAIFLLEIMFVLKLKKVFVFLKVMHLWEKIINFNQDIQSGENLDILNYF